MSVVEYMHTLGQQARAAAAALAQTPTAQKNAALVAKRARRV